MTVFDAPRRQRRFLAAAAVAVTLVVAAPTAASGQDARTSAPASASAGDPAPTPFTADVDSAPMDMPRPEARGRRPALQATSANLLYSNGRFRPLPDKPGAQATVHRGLNDRGQTVGPMSTTAPSWDPTASTRRTASTASSTTMAGSGRSTSRA